MTIVTKDGDTASTQPVPAPLQDDGTPPMIGRSQVVPLLATSTPAKGISRATHDKAVATEHTLRGRYLRK
jgi:hypothetical protein